VANPSPTELAARANLRHTPLVRVTHWLTTLCFLALLISGAELVISHPRFYWGEDGNSRMPALFQIPIPASRASVKTGYDFVLPDQNGWSRSLHFQTAWLVVITGLVYAASSLRSGHLRNNLLPAARDLSWTTLRAHVALLPADRRDDRAGHRHQTEDHREVRRIVTVFAASGHRMSIFPRGCSN